MAHTFRNLSPAARAAVSAIGVVQVSMFVAAQFDISRRKDDEVRGSKTAWRVASLVNVVGPLSYFRWGRVGG